MHNSKTLFNDFVSQITLPEAEAEIKSVGELVFENVLGLTRTDILADKPVTVSPETGRRLHDIALRINTREPVQYILGQAEFFGRKFFVNNAVLIPRPETEELILVVKAFAETKSHPRILDIGTGSGCIPITLALEIPHGEVYATDISTKGLEVAQRNASNLGASVSFLTHDILKDDIPLTDIDIIVSNPPYITVAEKEMMSPNVTNYEPHLALFVPNDDPLLFYKVIAAKSWNILSESGLLAVEINEKFGKEVAGLFTRAGFSDIEIIKDINRKNRIVRGVKTVGHRSS